MQHNAAYLQRGGRQLLLTEWRLCHPMYRTPSKSQQLQTPVRFGLRPTSWWHFQFCSLQAAKERASNTARLMDFALQLEMKYVAKNGRQHWHSYPEISRDDCRHHVEIISCLKYRFRSVRKFIPTRPVHITTLFFSNRLPVDCYFFTLDKTVTEKQAIWDEPFQKFVISLTWFTE